MNVIPVSTCFLNGEMLPLAEAKVSVLDRGFIFGDAVYEVIPTTEGRLFALPEHLRRLARNLAEVAIPDPMTYEQWHNCLKRLLSVNGGGEFLVYVQVSRGVAERDHAIPSELEPTVFAMCRPLGVSAGLARVAAVTLPDNRWGRCDIKSTSLLANILLRNQAIAAGAYEALLIRADRLTEGAASNVFVVSGGEVKTPPLSCDLLAGVTRGLLLDVIADSGIAAAESEIRLEELRSADEIWITSSTRDLMCVNKLDGAPVGDGQHYPVAEMTLRNFREFKIHGHSRPQSDPAAH